MLCQWFMGLFWPFQTTCRRLWELVFKSANYLKLLCRPQYSCIVSLKTGLLYSKSAVSEQNLALSNAFTALFGAAHASKGGDVCFFFFLCKKAMWTQPKRTTRCAWLFPFSFLLARSCRFLPWCCGDNYVLYLRKNGKPSFYF